MYRSSLCRRALVAATAAGVVASLAGSALAGGFSSARFGGAWNTPTHVNAASIFYNPGAMGQIRGNEVMLDVSLVYRSASYLRPESATSGQMDGNEMAANTGEATLSNFIYSPMAGFATDLGGSRVVLGGAFYVPFGGQAVWSRTDAPDDIPWAADGPQRWFTIDGTIRTMAFSLGAAVRTEDNRFSFGLATNLLLSSMSTVRARNSNGDDDVLSAPGIIQEGRSWLDVSSTDISIGLGAYYEAIPNRLYLGASWQSAPNITGYQNLEGDLINELGSDPRQVQDVIVRQRMPHTIRWGLAYRFNDEDEDGNVVRQRAEVRLSGDIATWNNMASQCIVERSQLVDGATARDACPVAADGTVPPGSETGINIVQNLVRDWRVGYSFRLGGSYFFSDRFELAGSLAYDSNVIPDRTLDPALMDMNKILIELGARYRATDWLALNFTFNDIVYLARDTTGNPSHTTYPAPNTQPSAAGEYRQHIALLNLNFQFLF